MRSGRVWGAEACGSVLRVLSQRARRLPASPPGERAGPAGGAGPASPGRERLSTLGGTYRFRREGWLRFPGHISSFPRAESGPSTMFSGEGVTLQPEPVALNPGAFFLPVLTGFLLAVVAGSESLSAPSAWPASPGGDG